MKCLIIFLGFLFLVSCAHHKDVRPSADGVHRVQLRAAEKEAGEREAIEQANHFCKEQGKFAAFVNESTKYDGDMKEEDYKKTKTGANIAKTVGGAAWAFGGKNESNVGGLIGLGGMAADAAAGEGYLIEMKFKCN